MPPPQHFVVDQNWPFGTKISHLGPKKPPGTVKSLKWPFWSFSAPGGHWEKRKQIYIMTLVQLFSIYMTSIHPRHLPDTLRHHPDTARHPETPSRHLRNLKFTVIGLYRISNLLVSVGPLDLPGGQQGGQMFD